MLDYAEVKALAVGDPLIKERVEAANELTRYMILQHKLVESRLRLEMEMLEIPAKIQNQTSLIESCKIDISAYEKWKRGNPPAADSRQKRAEAENRRRLREFIGNAVRENVLETKERMLMTYRGFEINLPANMSPERPYLWLKRSGKYYVELGDTDIGNLIRIDNFLDSLDEHLISLEQGLENLKDKERDIRSELSNDESYIDMIKKYKKKIGKLDKKLGVNKK